MNRQQQQIHATLSILGLISIISLAVYVIKHYDLSLLSIRLHPVPLSFRDNGVPMLSVPSSDYQRFQSFGKLRTRSFNDRRDTSMKFVWSHQVRYLIYHDHSRFT